MASSMEISAVDSILDHCRRLRSIVLKSIAEPTPNLYGAGATTGVVSLSTPRGTTSFPSLLFHGDAGNFQRSHEELELAGTHNRLDYLGAFSWLQTANDLPDDQFHMATTAGNFGWQPNSTTQLRGTVHYGGVCHRRTQRMGLLPRRGPRHAKRSEPLRQRVYRQPDHGRFP